MLATSSIARRSISLVLAIGAVATATALLGCQGHSGGAASGVMTRAQQEAITPEGAIARLAEGNARFVSGRTERRDTPAAIRASAGGQYPYAVILACIDSRTGPELVFDQGLGDVFVPRVAGNYVQADLLGSMEFAAKVMGAKAVVVMGHTKCGAVMGACDDVELGNITTVIRAIQPSVEAVQGVPGARTSANEAFVHAVTEENVRRNVAKIRSESSILREMESSGQIKIVGAMHDLSTGRVKFLAP